MNFRKQRNPRRRSNLINIINDSEKWRYNTRQVSLKDVSDTDEDSNNSETILNQNIDWEEEFFTQKDNTSDVSDEDHEIILTKKQTLILATLVPNELIIMDEFDICKSFVGVLLMADVSGFTALSECYHSSGKGGAYRLTVTLNTYLGGLIELIYSHGGDVIKYAGDAFLALWKNDKKTYLCHTIHAVITCALQIQHLYTSYETDVKVNLKVKLAISAGNLIFAPIGTGIDRNYVLTGLPVFEAKDAESVCVSGEVKLAANAWGHCYSRNYNHILHEDGHVTIKGILYDPRENDVCKPFLGLASLKRHQKKQLCAIESLSKNVWVENDNSSLIDALKSNEVLSIRETILESIQKDNGAEIRKFMIRPVVQQIDAHQPLEYLTEMRYVTIMFITLKPHKCSVDQLITIVNKTYEITCDMVYKAMGCVNKIILFDKDVMILAIFGLRGFKNESEAQAALKSAYSIKRSLAVLDGVLNVSIGVTTGQVYCGVVGHPLRREFTVIGSVVNKAARLMCYFKDKISCDDSTFIKSKMSANSFTLQPTVQLKGIANTGKIYEYSEEIKMNRFHDIPVITPLLNRSYEIDYFEKWVRNIEHSPREFNGILLVGENRVGKTRLLEWMVRQGKSSCFGEHTCIVNLTSIHSATPYLAINQIINKLLKLSEPIRGFDKEERIVEILKVYHEDLCYLNNIIKTRFAYHEGIYSQNNESRSNKSKDVFNQLIKALDGYFLISIDDLHNLDPFSWEYISILLNSPNIFTVLTITKEKINADSTWLYDVFVKCNIRKIILGSLSPEFITPLACQILDVDAIPKELSTALLSKCKCMPGLIESFLIHLFSSGALGIKIVTNDELKDMPELQFPEPILLHPIALNENNQDTLQQLEQSEKLNETRICFIIDKNELNTNFNVQNSDAIIIMQIDSLTPYQQLLVKIASVVGCVISRELLENIMYENNYIITAKAIKRLFSIKLFSCANSRYRWSRKTFTDPSLNSLPNDTSLCDCNFEYDEDDSSNLPKYAFCKLLKFKNRSTRKTCYELLPLNQKKDFHTRIVNYLEHIVPKCIDCGGIVLVAESFVAIQSRKQSCKITDTNNDLDSLYKRTSSRRHLSSLEMVVNDNFFSKPHTSATFQDMESYMNRSKSEVLKYDDNVKSTLSDTQFNEINMHQSILRNKCDKEHTSALHRRSTKRVTIPSILFKALSHSDLKVNTIFSKVRMVAEADELKDWEELGFDDNTSVKAPKKVNSNKSYRINLEKGVSQTNFKKCTCHQLNLLICEQLIHHARKADLTYKIVKFILNYCKLKLHHNNLKNVYERLSEAETICKDIHSNRDKINKLDRNRYLGKIYTYRSAANIISNNMIGAKIEIERALKIFHLNLNKFSPSVRFNKNFKKYKRKLSDNETLYTKDCISCLNIATVLYNNIAYEKLARTSAQRALKLLQKAECSVTQICDAYSNAIKVELDRGCPDLTEAVENAAKKSLRKSHPVKAKEIFHVGKLFLGSFNARICRGLLAPAMRSGFRSLVLSRFVFADNVSLEIIPDLFYVLLARKRLIEAVDVVTEILRIGEDQVEYEIWYYALCLDMILDAGFQLEYPGNIMRFADHVYTKRKNITNSSAWKRLVINVWTYSLRGDIDRKAKRWETEVMKWINHDDSAPTLSNLFTSLRFAEGMLESLSRKMEDLRKVVDTMELRSLADRELNRLEKDVRLCRILFPRWNMLMSNSLKLSGRNSAAAYYLTQATEEAKKTANHLELAKSVPFKNDYWENSAKIGYFMDWQDATEYIHDSWHEFVYRSINSNQWRSKSVPGNLRNLS